MLALTFDQAKTASAVAVVVLVAVAPAWIMKQAGQKLAPVVILGLPALLVWTQRISLQACTHKVRAAASAIGDPDVDTTCTFFGRDVAITRNSES